MGTVEHHVNEYLTRDEDVFIRMSRGGRMQDVFAISIHDELSGKSTRALLTTTQARRLHLGLGDYISILEEAAGTAPKTNTVQPQVNIPEATVAKTPPTPVAPVAPVAAAPATQPTALGLPIKRGPGRPRKVPTVITQATLQAQAPTPQPATPGQPETPAQDPTGASALQQPQVSLPTDTPPPMVIRPRGRPRKNPLPAAAQPEEQQAADTGNIETTTYTSEGMGEPAM